MKNNLYKVAFVATMCIVVFVLTCTNLTDIIKGFFTEEPHWNLFLDPWEIEEETYEGSLAKAWAPEGYEIFYEYLDGEWHTVNAIDSLSDETIIENPGVYHWVDWTWRSKDIREKYEPIYGSGLWIYDPADR